MKYSYSLFVALLLFVSCKDDKLNIPKGILHPDSLSAIQADFYVVEAAYNLTFIKADSLLPQYEDYYKEVLKRHNTRKSQLDSSIKFYSKHPEDLKNIYTRTLEILEVKKIKATPGHIVKDTVLK